MSTTENVRKTDQKFAVTCYAVAVCISAIAGAIVAAMVKQESPTYIYLSYLLPQIGYIGVFFAMKYKYERTVIKGLVRKDAVKPSHYLIGALIAVGLLFIALLPNTGFRKLFELMGIKASVVVPKMNAWYEYLLCGVVICVLPAIGEELVFRKAFCDGMEEVADYKTILLCGLAFSLSHLNAAQTVHQFFLGCVLATVYVKTKNVTVTMTMHFINNFLALYLERITGAEVWNNITVQGICFAVGAIAVGTGLFLLLKKGGLDNKKQGKIEGVTALLLAVLVVAWAIIFGLSFK